jgi:hypothetical protein
LPITSILFSENIEDFNFATSAAKYLATFT